MNSISFKLMTLLLVVCLATGCNKNKKANPGTKPSGNTDSTTQNQSYVELLQKKTNLIKSVVFDTTYTPYKGLSVTKLQYLNYKDQHLAVFFFTVDLSNPKIALEVGTGYNKPDFQHQTVTNMITYKNNADASIEVIAAVNGDYWSVHTSEGPLGEPLGIVYQNGVKIKGWPSNPPGGQYYYFAILKSKKAVLGGQRSYLLVKDSIEQGLGGRYLLRYHNHNLSGSLPKNIRNPRTSVGLISKTKVVFIVVDGRRKGYSVGVGLQTLEKYYAAIGAFDALNLDGGGSTTLVLRKGDSYVTANKPSGNQERAVDNSWMVMYKK